MEFNATFFVSVISFLVFVFLMNKIFYAPLETIMAEREKLVEDTLNAAKTSRDAAAKILHDRENKLNKADADSKKLVSERVEKSNADSKARTQKAKLDSVDKINSRKADLTKESNQIKDRLNNTAEELAQMITARILG